MINVINAENTFSMLTLNNIIDNETSDINIENNGIMKVI